MDVLADRIRHIVVLMMENRSFDSMLGTLQPRSRSFEGLGLSESNLFHSPGGNTIEIPVWNRWTRGGAAPDPFRVPDPDPGELFGDMNLQIFGRGAPSGPATMSGFVDSYMAECALTGNPGLPEAPMHYYRSDELPVLSALARGFAVCDQWHASAPCQTWPNRFFVHTGSAHGWPDNSPVHLPDAPTIFSRFDQRGIDKGWRIYFHDIPQALTLRTLWASTGSFRPFDSGFERDAQAGDLPCYTFIEPRYFADFDMPNDQHPPHDVRLGEQLIARVYRILRNSPCWERTLLVIVWDEHGGCFDHVPPPAAVAPEDPAPGAGFDVAAEVERLEQDSVPVGGLHWMLDPGLVPEGLFQPGLSPHSDLFLRHDSANGRLIIQCSYRIAAGAGRKDRHPVPLKHAAQREYISDIVVYDEHRLALEQFV